MTHDEIVAEIGSLTETTAALTRQLEQPKSKLDLFKEYAGIISLALSVATGFFAVYQTLVVEPQKSKADEQARLGETIGQLVSLDQEYAREAQQGDPNAFNGTWASKRDMLLKQAEDLSKRRTIASFEDQINLGNEYELGVNSNELAVSHFKASLSLAGNDPLKKATAETRIGKLDFLGVLGASLQDGRRLFDDAEHILGQSSSSALGVALVQSLSVRSWAECSKGEPAQGQKAKLKVEALLDNLARNPEVSPQSVDSLKNWLTANLSNTRCAQSATSSQVAPAEAQILNVSTNKVDLSNQIMQLLLQRKYSQLESQMSATLGSQFPIDMLQTQWDGLVPQIGPYKRTTGTKVTFSNNTPIYVVHCEFQNALVDLRLAFDATNHLSLLGWIPLSALPRVEIEEMATAIVSDFFLKKFDKVWAKFDATLGKLIPEGNLQEIWTQATNSAGSFDHADFGTKSSDVDLVGVLCQMQGGRLLVQVGYDLDMKINTFRMFPSK